MDKIINIIIVLYVFKVISDALKKFGKQQLEEINKKYKIEHKDSKKERTAVKYEQKTRPHYVPARVNETPPMKHTSGQPRKKMKKYTDRTEHVEEDACTLDLVQGIIMSEILNPPLSRRRRFGAF
ncbi:MAG: hypothetical protein ACMUIP_09975 [bacterium]